jgi:hypothetical protein
LYIVIWVFRKRNDGPGRFGFEDLLLKSRNHDGRREINSGVTTLLLIILKNTAKVCTVLVE